MIFEGQNYGLTDKELDFFKNNPESFDKYMDYCNNNMSIKSKMLDAHIKELDLDKKRLENDQKQIETNRQFWIDLTSIGIATFDYFTSKNQGGQK